MKNQPRAYGQGLKISQYGCHCSGYLLQVTDQEKQMFEALHRQIKAASPLQDLVLMRNFNHLVTCWSNNAAEHKQSRKLLECINDKFVTQVTEKSVRKGALLDFLLANEGALSLREGFLSLFETAVTLDAGIQEPERKTEDKKQDRTTGLQRSRL